MIHWAKARRLFGCFVAPALAVCGAGGSAAAQQSRADNHLAAIYSDICYHEEAGDLIGMPLIVVRGEGYDYVVLQWARGALTAPMVARANIARGTLSFTVNAGTRTCIGVHRSDLAYGGFRKLLRCMDESTGPKDVSPASSTECNPAHARLLTASQKVRAILGKRSLSSARQGA